MITSSDAQLSNTITETAGQTGDANPADAHSVGGVLNYTDVDLTDVDHINHTDATAVWTDRNGNTHSVTDPAIVAAGELVFGTVDQSGNTASWTYTVADNALDFLRAGETLTVSYAITVQDDSGAANDTSTTRDIVVTITGTNDRPVITSSDAQLSNTITETAGQTGDANPLDAHVVGGVVNYTDVDLTDVDHINHTDATAVWTDRNGNTHSVTDPAIVAAGDLVFGTVDQNANTASWTYTVADNALDFLAAGETLVVTYAVTVQDDSGAANDTSTTRDIVVTITGTNDAPVINAIAATPLMDSIDVSPLTATIGVTFTDADLTNIGHTAAITAVARAGVTAGLSGLTDAQLEAFVTPETVVKASGSSAGSVNLDFSAASTTFDYLAAGQVVTLTYTVAIDDHAGGVTPADVRGDGHRHQRRASVGPEQWWLGVGFGSNSSRIGAGFDLERR